MLPAPQEIREKLLTQLDDNNEVDEPTVVELVSILEGYPVKGLKLAETMIGRLANDLRKKIKNEKLAKRLKQLLRTWRDTAIPGPRVNGVHGQSPGLRRFCPAVSPSPNARHVAAGRGQPRTLAPHSASPALQNSRPGTPVGSKVSPSGAAALRSQRAQVGSGRTCLGVTASPSDHVVSPKVSGQVPSPAVPRSVSPAVTQTAAGAARRTASPALNKRIGDSPLVRSPALSLASKEIGSSNTGDSVRLSSNIRCKTRDISGSSNGGGRTTPMSLHSENSRDGFTGQRGNGRPDSDGESSCSSWASQPRITGTFVHSTSTDRNNSASINNQRELSKANVSSRKRLRIEPITPPETHHKSRADPSDLSSSNQMPDNVVNGHRKSRRRRGAVESSGVSPSLSSSTGFVDKGIVSPLLSASASDGHAVPSPSSLWLRQESSSPVPDQTSPWHARDVNRGKVKTTQQLIQDLQRKNSSSNLGNDIINKLRTNRLERESTAPNSVLPARGKAKGKRGRKGAKNEVCASVPSSQGIISKNELVEHFLNTSDPSSSVDDCSQDALPALAPSTPNLETRARANSGSKGSCDANFLASHQERSESGRKEENNTNAATSTMPSTSQPAKSAFDLELEAIYAQLPPINYNIDWESVYGVPERAPVTDEHTDRLHNDHQPGINGMHDIKGNWTTWQQCVTLPSFEGEQLHILPYVDLDN